LGTYLTMAVERGIPPQADGTSFRQKCWI